MGIATEERDGEHFRILAFGDDPAIERLTTLGLRWLSVSRVREPDGVAAHVKQARPQAVVLGSYLGPGEVQGRLCRSLRALGIRQPIIVITATRAMGECLSLVDDGATDVVERVDDALALLLRTLVAARRLEVTAREQALRYEETLHVGPLSINRRTTLVSLRGTPVHIPRQSRLVLEYLAEHAGATIGLSELERACELPHEPSHRRLHTAVWRLRSCLGELGAMVENVRGSGFRLRPSEYLQEEV